jgi:hypothetical protein
LIAEKGKQIFRIPKTQQAWAKLRGVVTPRYSTKYLEALLKQYLVRDNSPLTLRDTLKPMLIPCYNLETAGSFLFSRAWALIDEKWNFNLWEICRATSAVPSYFKPAKMRSTNGVTSCTAVDGGLTMNNPTAAAITHVLHNKVEFPGVEGTRDMLVLSLGTGQFDQKYDYGQVRHWGAFQWATPVVKIVLDGISDMVDHTVSMSFGDLHKQYLRVQVLPAVLFLCVKTCTFLSNNVLPLPFSIGECAAEWLPDMDFALCFEFVAGVRASRQSTQGNG